MNWMFTLTFKKLTGEAYEGVSAVFGDDRVADMADRAKALDLRSGAVFQECGVRVSLAVGAAIPLKSLYFSDRRRSSALRATCAGFWGAWAGRVET